MRVLIVFSHPENGSYLASVFRQLVGELEGRGHLVRAIDLYYDAFDPVLDVEAWRRHRRNKGNPAGVLDHVAALAECEALIFIFPTWWYGLPAMLKGWIDRVWQPGVAFTVKDGAFQTHALRNIRRFGVITTCGSPGWFIAEAGDDPVRRQLMQGLALQFARGVRKSWRAIYNTDRRTPEDLAKARDRAVERMVRFIGPKK